MYSTPYHPEGNGSTERTIGSIKTIIITMCQARSVPVEDWDLLLDKATLAYNNTVNKSRGFSPLQVFLEGEQYSPLTGFARQVQKMFKWTLNWCNRMPNSIAKRLKIAIKVGWITNKHR